jgi:predicted secreted hydrolase
MRKFTLIIGALLIAGILVALPLLLNSSGNDQVQSQLVEPAAAADPAGFARAEQPRQFQFPADFGAHPDYQTEWWYYTGNLETTDGHHFGYQLTFFRRALLPPTDADSRASDWATRQVYMAHFTVTDVAAARFQAFESFSRAAGGLAGAQAEPYRVWLDNWSVKETGTNTYQLQAARGDLAIDLTLTDTKGPILQGERGFSQKGPSPGQASYYYSQTHLVSQGSVKVGKLSYQVSGLSWMDHEFSTSALAKDQVGWDWFALQLSNGSELMVFQIRKADGSIDPFSSGTLIGADGSSRHLSRDDFQIKVEATWKSPHTQATYPSRRRVIVPSADLSLEIEPYLADQELNVSYSYWEGAVHFNGTAAGQEVKGSGYIEMTGYTKSMGGEF